MIRSGKDHKSLLIVEVLWLERRGGNRRFRRPRVCIRHDRSENPFASLRSLRRCLRPQRSGRGNDGRNGLDGCLQGAICRIQIPIAKMNLPPGNRRNPFTGQKNSDKVQRISRRQRHNDLARPGTRCAQTLSSFLQRKLLTKRSANETSAANLSTRLQPPQHRRKITPCRSIGLARQQFAKQNAVARQQNARVRLERRISMFCRIDHLRALRLRGIRQLLCRGMRISRRGRRGIP